MKLQPGREAVVRVSVATLWADPGAVRPVDRPALAPHTDIPAWIDGMDADQRVGDCVLTQLLLGERVLVTALRPGGWAHVVALGQPCAKRDPRGYPGWLPAAQLTPADQAGPAGAPLVVDAAVTALHLAPGGPAALSGVVLGTRVDPAGTAVDGWQLVHVPGRASPLWILEADAVPLPTGHPKPTEVLALAERLRDAVYVWGGLSSHGIDCSGLVHLAWRRFGVTLPRNAHDQAGATTQVPLGEERPGDLYLFARPGRHIHHIGIVTAEPSAHRQRMLHACYQRRRVLEEPLSPERVATLVAVRRV